MKFWNWRNEVRNSADDEKTTVRVLELNGPIAEYSWFDDEVTPKIFKEELNSGSGDIVVWINSPGGDCIAAAQIYNMLSGYEGNVTVKIDGIAASAASVIAMSGDRVMMSPVSMLMIHNPSTIAWGDHAEMEKVIDMLNEVKESIINAYEIKTGMSRDELSRLMDEETWMNAEKALELGFVDEIIKRDKPEGAENSINVNAVMYSQKAMNNCLMNKLEKHYAKPKETPAKQAEIKKQETGRSVKEIKDRLLFIKKFI